jgi:hypothetical protein
MTAPAAKMPKPGQEGRVAEVLRREVRQILAARHRHGTAREDLIAGALRRALGRIGAFFRMDDGTPLFFRRRDRRLYSITDEAKGEFGRFVTFLSDVSVKAQQMGRCLDRIRASVSHQAKSVRVHALAYNGLDGKVIAVNDFGGGMWVRRRGGAWTRKPNGHAGLLFWTPGGIVEPWQPEFSTVPGIHDEDHLRWFLEQPHFADDVLTVPDQRMLLHVLLLERFFPFRCRVRPVHAHLGLSQQRQHDTGKTAAGKQIGLVFVGSRFEPMPPPGSSERGVEALRLELMHSPFVLLDNVDTDAGWLNDFLCTYATGARPSQRKLFTDTEQALVEYRGRLAITSRRAKFNRADTASRTIPFRFAPIAPTERRTEWELLEPVLARRGQLWAGLLAAVARVQDALPTLTPPSSSLRLADFEQFGWCVAAVYGEAHAWQAMIPRLRVAQAGFALEDEPLAVVLRHVLADGDVLEQRTSEFFTRVRKLGQALDLDSRLPIDAATCTRRIHELQDALEAVLDVKIRTRILAPAGACRRRQWWS